MINNDFEILNLKVIKAGDEDLEEILNLQKLAYQSEAKIYNDFKIQPLTQTLAELMDEFKKQVFFKVVEKDIIIGSIRGFEKDGTCFVNKVLPSAIILATSLNTVIRFLGDFVIFKNCNAPSI